MGQTHQPLPRRSATCRLRRLAGPLAALAVLLGFASSAAASPGELSFVERAPQFDLADGDGVGISPDGKNLYAGVQSKLVAFQRDAATGDLSFLEEERDQLDDPTDPGGMVLSLRRVTDVAVSPDGKTVYATCYQPGNSVVVFARDPATGLLTYLESERDGYDDPEDEGGTVEDLFRPDKVVVAPDGTSVYALTGNGGNSLAVFERDPATGRLSYLETEVNGVDDPSDPGGTVQGIAWGEALAIAPDGGAVYAASYSESRLAIFERDKETGELSFVEYEQDGVDDGSGTVDGLSNPVGIAPSPDGDFVYVVGRGDHALAMFKRDGGTEELDFLEFEKNGVDDAGDAGGTVTGMASPYGLAVSADGFNVYVVGRNSDAVASFRFAAGGEIVFVDSEPTVEKPTSITLAPGDKHAYVGASDFSGLALLSRTTTSPPDYGRLESLLYVGGELQLGSIRGIAVSPDGRHLCAPAYERLTCLARDPGSGALTELTDVERNEVDDPSDPGGEVEYLEEPTALAFSPDGGTLYATDTSSYAVHAFGFDPVGGELIYLESERDETDDPGDAGGEVRGLYEPWDVVVAPDGGGVFAVGNSDESLVAFDRDPATGRLSFVEREQDGVDGAEGLRGAEALAISPDGATLYAGGGESEGELGVFARDPATDQLTFLAAEELGDEVEDLIVTPDGAHVYLASHYELVRLDRDTGSGLLSFGAVTEPGIDDAEQLELSVDGRQLYVAGGYEVGALATLAVGAAGELTPLEVEQTKLDDPGDPGPAPEGLASPAGLAISPDDRNLYLASEYDRAIAVFARQGEPEPPVPTPDPPASESPDTMLQGGLVKAARKQRQKGKQIVVKITLGAGEKATGTAWGKVEVGKRSYKLKKLTRSLAAGRAQTLRLKPANGNQRRWILRLLKRGRKLKARVSGRVVDRAGNALRRTLTVRLPYKRQRPDRA
ncbi:MAG: beta-propeller fold lactonase family protein [Solirubrobacterales bacterium]